MRLLITGAAGFIASTFVDFALINNETLGVSKITGIDAFTYAGNENNLKNALSNNRFELVRGNICDSILMSELVENCDVVINFAAETHVDNSITNPTPFFETNLMGTLNLLKYASLFEKRFIQISTDEVYGSIKSGSWHENFPLMPNSPYAASKAGADLLIRSYHKTYGTQINISRCCNNYGPRQYPEKIIPYFVLKLVRGEKIPIYGDGSNLREWIHVNDHVRGIAKVLQLGRQGEIYNIGSGFEISNLELAFKILRILELPQSKIEFVNDRHGHDFRYSLDCTKIRNELKFECNTDFEFGLLETVLAFAREFS